MKCNPWVAVFWLGACAALVGCSSAPKLVAAKPSTLPLQPDCGWRTGPGGESQMACLLADDIPDTQWDAKHLGSVACSPDSFSVFKQSMSAPLRLSHGPRDEDAFSQVRISGTLGPGTHQGQVGKSTGNDCDATVGSVAAISTRYGGGSYTAVVDKSQVPVCVRQSRLVLGGFEQTLSKALPVNLAQAGREATIDALQKRLDLEVAVRLNKHWRPSAPFLREVTVSRHGRCAEGFRSLSSP